MNEKENHYVVWSGGADSTYLLWTLAKESSENNTIKTISIIHDDVNDNKKIKEKEARNKIINWMKEKDYHIKNYSVKISSNIPSKDYGGRQHMCWLGAIMPLIPPNSSVHFGYVYEDSFWHKKGEFVKTFYDFDRMSVHTSNSKLYFDLEWTHKKDIIKELKEIGLYKLIWTCEEPTKNLKKCGKCTPCLTEKKCFDDIKHKI